MLSLEEMKANRRKWVEALRSGKYEQGYGVLQYEESYCCLGVACRAMGMENRLSGGSLSPRNNLAHVREMLGLQDEMGCFDGGELARLNDNRRSFSEIADIIESEPKGLFVEAE